MDTLNAEHEVHEGRSLLDLADGDGSKPWLAPRPASSLQPGAAFRV
jgi:hypothetical protein